MGTCYLLQEMEKEAKTQHALLRGQADGGTARNDDKIQACVMVTEQSKAIVAAGRCERKRERRESPGPLPRPQPPAGLILISGSLVAMKLG